MNIVRYSYPGARFLSSDPVRSLWSGFENEVGRLIGWGEEGALPVDVQEDENGTYLRAELPGVKREDINIETADGVLTIAATRKYRRNGTEETVSLRRSVALPERVEADKISASYEDGVLTVTLPKPEQAKPRKIAVEVK